ncbi:hypothetical protein ACFVUS_12565 [Nocardia sp. NPDC058058]|uniref:hypothetical protein n=1 Tax=Nocardia sp. NPDC058058 TaxID=3346317 RepID=UPI0036D91756
MSNSSAFLDSDGQPLTRILWTPEKDSARTLVEQFATYDNQLPRIFTAPFSTISTGKRVIALAELCGLYLDPWEKFVIEVAHRVSPETARLIAKQIGIVCQRQNGKGEILVALGLGWLFITREELVLHSAHQFKTCADSYRRLKRCIKRVPELRAMVKKFNDSHGHEGIELHEADCLSGSATCKCDGPQYKFIARAGGSGRGFPAKKAVFDEAYDLSETEIEDIMPTLTAAPDGQAWFTSSAVNKNKHPNGKTLSKIRHRGLTGTNAERLAFFEWSVPEELSKLEYDDVFWWKMSNPGWDYRPDMLGALQSERDLMSLESFGQEHLGVGDYFPPDDDGGVITVDQWNGLLDPTSKIVGKRVFALDIAPYGKQAAVAVCGLNADGLLHAEVIKYGKGTRWVVDYLTTRCGNWSPLAVIWDRRTASASLEDELLKAKIPLEEIKALQVAQAFSMFYDKCTQTKTIRHPDQPSINEALLDATTRRIGDGLAWDTRDVKTDITGLVAITNATWGFSMKISGYVDVAQNVW